MQFEDILGIKVPSATLVILLRLARTLLEHAPSKTNAAIDLARAKLEQHIVEIEDARVARTKAKNNSQAAEEAEFDRGTDALWVCLRTVLDQVTRAFGHAGLDHLTPARKQQIELEELRSLARASATIHGDVFAADGTRFTQASMPEQAEAMTTNLLLIKSEGHDERIAGVIVPRLFKAVEICQEQYDEMVSDRMVREAGASTDLRPLRERLRFLLGRYKAAVESLYDEDDPESVEMIATALAAMIQLDTLSRRRGGSLGAADEVSPELDEFLVADAVDEELVLANPGDGGDAD